MTSISFRYVTSIYVRIHLMWTALWFHYVHLIQLCHVHICEDLLNMDCTVIPWRPSHSVMSQSHMWGSTLCGLHSDSMTSISFRLVTSIYVIKHLMWPALWFPAIHHSPLCHVYLCEDPLNVSWAVIPWPPTRVLASRPHMWKST